MKNLSWIAMVALTSIIGGCSSDDRNGTSGYGDNGRIDGATVDMTAGGSFNPREVTIKAGDSILWKNSSKEIHTVSADSARALKKESVSLPSGANSFHSGEIQPGKTWRTTFSVPGTYKYVCTLHENRGMTGVVIVKPSSDAGAPSPY